MQPGGLKMVQRKRIRIRGINNMVYILVAIIAVLCWFLCVGIAKFIDLLNKNQDWYIKLGADLEEDN